ncbi:MAG: OPT/YSL family transporter, partial [Armatimonadota bacterium]|nr:OPT/YSL family transporter [Armatimonadota bacterium]
IGLVLPFPVVIGTFIAAIGCHVVANPFLYKLGILHTWTPGVDLIQTNVVNSVDFYLSFGIGTSIVVALVGIGSVILALVKRQRSRAEGTVSAARLAPPPGRGDIPIWISLLVWVIGTVAYIGLCAYLVPKFPFWLLVFFGFVWTPLFSYINARMAGMAGTHVSIPYVREASFMMSGYKDVDIWFAPLPLADYGGMASHFRTVELTRTKFISIVKVELLMLPVMLITSFLFWSFIWRLAPIPSSVYPYASKFWPAHAQMSALWMTANRMGENNFLLQSIKPEYITAGGVVAALAYGIISLTGLPILAFYGLISGTHAHPPAVIPMFIGALLGRYYFRRRYGAENWQAYTPVLVAGYYCGMGLIGMGAVSLALLSKSVSRLPF